MARPKKGADGLYRQNFSYNGKRYAVRSKNPNELSRKMQDKLRELENKSPLLHPEMTVADWAQEWLRTCNSNLRTASFERTRGILANHLCAHLGHMKLNAVRPIHLQQVLNRLAEEGKSLDTVKHTLQTANRLFRSAQENRLVEDNPARALTLPQCAAPQSHRALTARERKILLRTAETHRAGPWVLLLLYTGLRPGESAALDAGDVRGGLIHVSKALDGRTNEIKDPKSRAGVRSVPIPQPLAPFLPREGSLPPDRPLFTQFGRTSAHLPTGKRHTKQSLRTLWADFAAAMAETEQAMAARREILAPREPLPPLTPYDLRHTYCTDLARSGVPLVTASRLMGHSSVELTAKIYTHVDQSMTLGAAAQLNAFYRTAADTPTDAPETVLTPRNPNPIP